MTDLKLDIRILTMPNAVDRQSTLQATIAASRSLSRNNHAFFFAVKPDDVGLEHDDYRSYLNSQRTLSRKRGKFPGVSGVSHSDEGWQAG